MGRSRDQQVTMKQQQVIYLSERVAQGTMTDPAVFYGEMSDRDTVVVCTISDEQVLPWYKRMITGAIYSYLLTIEE